MRADSRFSPSFFNINGKTAFFIHTNTRTHSAVGACVPSITLKRLNGKHLFSIISKFVHRARGSGDGGGRQNGKSIFWTEVDGERPRRTCLRNEVAAAIIISRAQRAAGSMPPIFRGRVTYTQRESRAIAGNIAGERKQDERKERRETESLSLTLSVCVSETRELLCAGYSSDLDSTCRKRYADLGTTHVLDSK